MAIYTYYLSHAFNSIKNFVVQISGRQKIHYDQAHEQSNKTIKSIKGQIDFVNRASDELQRRLEIAGLKIAEY